MTLIMDEIIDILDQEINWHINHPDAKLSGDFQEGFCKGLMQARRVLKRANEQKLKSLADALMVYDSRKDRYE